MNNEDIDHESTDEIVCPYCGYVHTDSWEWEGHHGTDRCDDCEKEFYWTRHVDITYDTSKEDEL